MSRDWLIEKRSEALTNDVLKIMILSLEYPPDMVGGLGTHVFELTTGLARMNCQVTVLAFTPLKSRIVEDGNLTAHLIAPSATTRSKVLNSEVGRRAITEAVSFNDDLVDRGQNLITEQNVVPDLIHCHDWFSFPAACELGQRFGISVVGTVHIFNEPIVGRWGDLPDPDVRAYERELYGKADAIITVSESMRDIARSFYGLPDDHVYAVHNGFDSRPFTKKLQPQEAERLRRKIAKPNEKIVIFAGRLTPQKGITALFESAAQVIEQYPHVRYLVVGEPDSNGASGMVKDVMSQFPQLRGKVQMLGWVPRSKLAMLYQIADLALVPSVYEPFGYAAVEAMAAGVPVIASRVGGLAEIIQDGTNGLLIPVHASNDGPYRVDVEELAAAQIRLLGDEALAQQIGRAGQQHVANAFSVEAMTEATISVYKQTISRFRAHNQSGSNRHFSNSQPVSGKSF